MVNLVTALPAEAKPLINHFLLKPTHSKPFCVFSAGGGPAANFSATKKDGSAAIFGGGGQDDGIRLIISGMRKEKSGRAVSFLHELSGAQDEAWINIGIAGHRDHAIGTGVLAHKIIDSKTSKSWYPALVFRSPCATEALLTVNRAESRYASPYVYDMEASGFYESALRYSTVELVHCYKVISDNSKSSHWKVTPRLVEQMMGNRLNEITILVTELQKWVKVLRSLEVKTEELEPFLIRWHFTVTEQFQLERLIRRLKTLLPEKVFRPDEFDRLADAKKVLDELRSRINQIPYVIPAKAGIQRSLDSPVRGNDRLLRSQ